MPRKSAASLSVVPLGLPAKPSPPRGLTKSQLAQWGAIVGEMPHDYFTAGSMPLLVAFVRAVDAANTIAKMIQATDINEDLGRYSKLLEMAARETKSMCALAQKMRLAQSAGPDSRKTVKTRGTGQPPWERRPS